MTARKHLTRHEMKQDELVSWMTRAIVYVEENSSQVLMGIGGLVVVILLILGATSWVTSRTEDAYARLAQVQEVVRTPLAMEVEPGVEAFATASERAQRVLDAADAMLADYSSGDAANWARYYRAVALLELGRAEEAAAAAEKLGQVGDSLLGGLAMMLAGQAEEALSNLQAAADNYARAATFQSSGFPPELALIGEGRCLDSMGRTAEAVEAYQKVLDLYPDSPLASRASRKLQELRGSGS